MSPGERTLDTGVQRGVAVRSGLPAHWSYSSLNEVEECELRYALANARFPEIWDQRGFPRTPTGASIFGEVVHESLDRIVRALIRAGCTGSSSPRAFEVLRELGGYTAVIAGVVEKRCNALDTHPLLTAAHKAKLRRKIEDRIPDARSDVQGRLLRLALVPRKGVPMQGDHSLRADARTALGPGTYAEVTLEADDPRIRGRVDLLTITAGSANILDHKTGTSNPDHLEQLRFYSVLWSRDRSANPATCLPTN